MLGKFLHRMWHDKRGNALMIVGAAMPLLVGSAGLASDTIQWTLWKRQLQRAADSAAIAGVYASLQGQTVAGAVDTDLFTDKTASLKLRNAIITLNGGPTISYPPSTSNYKNAVKVALSYQKPLAFSSMFMATPPTIAAEGVAGTVQTGVYCVVSLESTGATGITATGNGGIDLGCGMITNSTSMTAAIATGSSRVNATPIAAVGDIQSSTNWGNAELLPFTVKEDDPFASISPPTFTGCQGNTNRLRVISSDPVVDRTADTGVVCFSDMSLNGTVNLGSATYVIDGGSFGAGAQAKISCTGCTIILTNSDPTSTDIGTVDIDGGAEMKMTAPTDPTHPYDGLLFYQDRRAVSGPSKVNKINGNSASVLGGAFYFPNQQLDINGNANLNFACGQFVARNVSFSGNGGITNTCTGGYGDDTITGRHVRLVG
jgi:Flp pilus assembly protein TadG